MLTELLFSYGTLRQRDVQLVTFGRELDGRLDAIVGYDLDWVTITDPHVIATSGTSRHRVLVPSDDPGAAVEGSVFTISADDLAAADDYEVDDYRRVAVPLRSGREGLGLRPRELTGARPGCPAACTAGCTEHPAARPPDRRRRSRSAGWARPVRRASYC